VAVGSARGCCPRSHGVAPILLDLVAVGAPSLGSSALVCPALRAAATPALVEPRRSWRTLRVVGLVAAVSFAGWERARRGADVAPAACFPRFPEFRGGQCPTTFRRCRAPRFFAAAFFNPTLSFQVARPRYSPPRRRPRDCLPFLRDPYVHLAARRRGVRIANRSAPIMIFGLALQGAVLVWVAARGALRTALGVRAVPGRLPPSAGRWASRWRLAEPWPTEVPQHGGFAPWRTGHGRPGSTMAQRFRRRPSRKDSANRLGPRSSLMEASAPRPITHGPASLGKVGRGALSRLPRGLSAALANPRPRRRRQPLAGLEPTTLPRLRLTQPSYNTQGENHPWLDILHTASRSTLLSIRVPRGSSQQGRPSALVGPRGRRRRRMPRGELPCFSSPGREHPIGVLEILSSVNADLDRSWRCSRPRRPWRRDGTINVRRRHHEPADGGTNPYLFKFHAAGPTRAKFHGAAASTNWAALPSQASIRCRRPAAFAAPVPRGEITSGLRSPCAVVRRLAWRPIGRTGRARRRSNARAPRPLRRVAVSGP